MRNDAADAYTIQLKLYATRLLNLAYGRLHCVFSYFTNTRLLLWEMVLDINTKLASSKKQCWIKTTHSIYKCDGTEPNTSTHKNIEDPTQSSTVRNMSIFWQKWTWHKKYKVKSFVLVVALKKAGWVLKEKSLKRVEYGEDMVVNSSFRQPSLLEPSLPLVSLQLVSLQQPSLLEP